MKLLWMSQVNNTMLSAYQPISPSLSLSLSQLLRGGHNGDPPNLGNTSLDLNLQHLVPGLGTPGPGARPRRRGARARRHAATAGPMLALLLLLAALPALIAALCLAGVALAAGALAALSAAGCRHAARRDRGGGRRAGGVRAKAAEVVGKAAPYGYAAVGAVVGTAQGLKSGARWAARADCVWPVLGFLVLCLGRSMQTSLVLKFKPISKERGVGKGL